MAIKGNGFDGFGEDSAQNGGEDHGLFDLGDSSGITGAGITGLTGPAGGDEPLAEAAPIVLEVEPGADRLEVPGRGAFLEGEFFRNDTDLEVRLPDGQLVVIQDYFGGGEQPMLITEGGARISPELANVLAPDPTANMLAQTGDVAQAEAVGQITQLKGTVYIQRNGEKIEAEQGAQVFETDIVVTEEGAGAGITFIDGTNFGLGAKTRMAMTEFKWRPETDKGEVLFDVLQGAFSFTSGDAGKVKPDNIQIKMGSMSLGVRGTTVTGFNGEQTGEDSFVMLLEDAGGSVGKILVSVGDDEGFQLLESANTFVKTDIEQDNLPSFGRVTDPGELIGTTGTNPLDYMPGGGGSGSNQPNADQGPDGGDSGDGGTEGNGDAPNAEAGPEGDAPPAEGEGDQPPAPVEGQGEGQPGEGEGEDGEQAAGPEGDQPPPVQDGNREVPPIIETASDDGGEGEGGQQGDGTGQTGAGPNGQAGDGTGQGGLNTGGEGQGEQPGTQPPPPVDDDRETGNANVTANADAATVSENDGQRIELTANDTDPDAQDRIGIVRLEGTEGLNGQVQVTADRQGVAYNPGQAFQQLAEGQTATETFQYRVTDGRGSFDTAVVTVTITGSNDAPVARPDGAIVTEGQQVQLDLLGNDNDVDAGASLRVTEVAGVSVDSDGRIIYDTSDRFDALADGQLAQESFTYKVTDEFGATATATVTMTIRGVNDAPQAASDAFSVSDADGPVLLDLLANDTDADQGEELRVVSIERVAEDGSVGAATAPDGAAANVAVAQPLPQGELELQDDGQVVYQPNRALAQGQTTVEVYRYTVRDSAGETSTSTVTITVTGSNDAPEATNDTISATEDQAAQPVDLTANDSDVDQGAQLSVSALQTDGLKGTAQLTPGGQLVYNPNGAFESLNAGETATETFSYTLTDEHGATSTASITVTITGRNDGPQAGADQGQAVEDGAPVVIDVLANDSDADATATLSVTSLDTTGLKGKAQITPEGKISYSVGKQFQRLAEGETATEQLTYTVTDDNGATSTATVTITVTGTNDAPVAEADVLTVSENDPGKSVRVLENDSDIDRGDTLTITGIETDGLQGQAQIVTGPNGGQRILYRPQDAFQSLAEGQQATETITYTVADASGATSTASLTITVEGRNDGPVANGDQATVGEDDGFTRLNVTDNDTDVDDGAVLKVKSVDTSGINGVVQITPDGDIVYRAGQQLQGLAEGATVVETFTYTVEDEHGATSTATVSVTVTGANDAPVARDDARTLGEDAGATLIPIRQNDSDVDDGSQLRVLQVDDSGLQGSANVVLAQGGQALRYDPGSAFDSLAAGEVATETITYTLVDEHGATDTATVTVTITGSNDGPVAQADARTVGEDADVTVINVLANDSDVDNGAELTITNVFEFGSQNVIVGPKRGGEMTISADGKSLRYDPGSAFNNLAAGETATDSFTYVVTDQHGATDTATVTMTIIGTNDAPVARADLGTVGEDSPSVTFNVLGNDTDADRGADLTITGIDTSGVQGAVSIGPNNATLRYDVGSAFNNLAAGETATETFSYTVTDDQGATDTATVTVTITGSNDGPVAQADARTVTEDAGATTIDVLANDADVDNGAVLTITGVNTGGLQGAVSIAPDGKTLRYDPGSSFDSLGVGQTATETFSYTVQDDQGATDTATVTITITGTNDAPVAQADTLSVGQNDNVTIVDVLANDTDPDAGTELTIESFDAGSLQGNVSFALGNARLRYDPAGQFANLAAGETTTETFTYVASDEEGGTDIGSVTVTITGVNDGPVANDDVLGWTDDTDPVNVNVVANDTDVDNGATLEVISVSYGGDAFVEVLPDNKTISYGFDGSSGFEYLGAGETATEVITYTLQDDQGATDTASVTVTITGVNNGPVGGNDTGAVNEDASVTLNLLSNDTDEDTSDTIEISAVNTAGLLGSVVIAPDGQSVTYTAGGALSALDAGDTVTETFTYTVRDSQGATDTASVTVTVTGQNDGPVANGDVMAWVDGADPALVNVVTNDSDLDEDATLEVVGVNYGGDASVVILQDNQTIGYGFDGASGFEYLGAGETATEIITYTLQDDQGATDTATVTVTIVGVNDGPTGTNDVSAALEDQSVMLNLLSNDEDEDTSDTLEISAVNTSGLLGSVVIAPDGQSVTYTAGGALSALDAGDTTTETFTYTVRDSAGETDTASVTITVAGQNDGPVANDDTLAWLDGGDPVSVLATANDTDLDEDATLEIISVAYGGSAIVDISPDKQSIGYGFDGPSSFKNLAAGETTTETITYTLQDDQGATDTATVTVTITGINNDPKAMNNAVSVTENVPFIFDPKVNDTDIDNGDTFSITGLDLVEVDGNVTITPGNQIRYDSGPAWDFLAAGQTDTETITYTITDAGGLTDTATITVTVTGVNDVPIANDDNPTPIFEDTPPQVFDVLQNDIDRDQGSNLTIISIDTTGLQGDAQIITGGIQYDSQGAFLSLNNGQSAAEVITYTVQDDQGATATATLTVIIQGKDSAPMGGGDNLTFIETASTQVLDVLANDVEHDSGDAITITAVDDTGLPGSIQITDGGLSLTFVASGVQAMSASQTADYTFTYTVTDSQGLTDVVTSTLTIQGQNAAPVAVFDSVSFNEDDGPTQIDVLGNDTDADLNAMGDTAADTLTITSIDDTGLLGSATLTGEGLVYDPNGAFEHLAVGETATESLFYTVSDAFGGTSSGVVSITIHGANDDPDAIADSFAIGEDDGAVTLDVLANDIEPDANDTTHIGMVHMVTPGVSTSHLIAGPITYDAGDTFQYLQAGETATDTFVYQIEDPHYSEDSATVTMTITGSNDQLSVVGGDDAVSVSNFLTAYDLGDMTLTDPDAGDEITITVELEDLNLMTLGSGLGGVFSAITGQWSFTGTAAEVEAAYNDLSVTTTLVLDATRLNVTISDGLEDGAVPVTFDVDINGPNNTRPVAEDSLSSVLTGDVLSSRITGATDADGDALIYSLLSGGTKGNVNVNSDGTFTYTPAPLVEGTDSFVYKVQDAFGVSDTATMYITIGAENGHGRLVNTTVNNAQTDSSVAALVGGGYVVVWTDNSASGADQDGKAVRGQLFDDFGKKTGTEFVVNSYTTGDQFAPSVAALNDGGFVVQWEGSTTNVHVAQFDADGTARGPAYLSHVHTAGVQSDASTAVLSDGKIVYAVLDDDGMGASSNGPAILVTVQDGPNGTLGSSVVGAYVDGGTVSQPTVQALSDGKFVLSWTENAGGSDEVRFQLFNDDGSTQGPVRDLFVSNAVGLSGTDIAALDGDSCFVAVWQQDGGGQDIVARLFSHTGQADSGEIIVNTSTTGVQTDAQVTALAGGRFVVTWTDTGQNTGDTSNDAVRGQVFNSDGTMFGSEFLVNTITADDQNQPDVTTLSDGGFVVSWTDRSEQLEGSGNQQGIHHKVFNEDGTVRRADQHETLAADGAGDQLDPTVLGLADGTLYAAWTDHSGATADMDGAIFGRQFDAMGAAQDSADTQVNANPAGLQEEVSLAQFASGDVIAVWTSSNAPGDGQATGLRAQIADLETNSSQAEFTLNSVTAGEQFGADLAAMGNTAMVAAWTTTDSDEGDIHATIFDDQGGTQVAEFQINQNAGGNQNDVQLAALGNGDAFVAAWTSFDAPGDTSQSGISARIFDDQGVAVTDEIVLNSNHVGIQHEADVVGTEDGGFFASWTNMVAQDGDQSGIIGRFFDDQGIATSTEFVVNTTTAGMQRDASAARLEDGDIVVTWTDYSATGSGGTTSIRGQILDGETGGMIGLEFNIEAQGANLGDSHVTALADGGFAVGFENDSALYGDMEDAGARLQIFNADGTARQEVDDAGPAPRYRAALSEEVVADLGDTVSTDTGDFTINGNFSGEVDLGAGQPGNGTSESGDLADLLADPGTDTDSYSSSGTSDQENSTSGGAVA